jgi:adenosylhomocysteine nucleosidase
MNILVTYAVEAEFAPWRALRNLEKVTVGGVALPRAQVGRATVDFVITGMGSENATRVVEAVISSTYSFCIVSGFAGALNSSVKLGQIVAPEKVRHHDSRQIEICDPDLLTRACMPRHASENSATRIATLLTTDQVVNTAAEKNRLCAFAEAVDMESFAILHAANKKNIPGAVVRVISDSFDRDMPAELDAIVDPQGHVKIAGVVRYIAKHPLMIPALVRLSRDSKSAAEALAHFLESYINKLSAATHGNPPTALQEVAAS